MVFVDERETEREAVQVQSASGETSELVLRCRETEREEGCGQIVERFEEGSQCLSVRYIKHSRREGERSM